MITLEKKGPIAILTLNRPDAMNALGEPGDGEAVRDVCAQINADKSLRCAILTGAGKGFSAGGNVKAMRDRVGSFAGSPAEVRDNYKNGVHMIVRALYNLEIPLIAAVNGAAVGLGCDVACMADIRISSDNAKYGVTFLKLGLIPGDGGAWLLPRVIGMSRACELLFTGNLIDAKTAQEWGLVSKVVPGDQLMTEAMALATSIAKQPSQSLRVAKQLLRHGTQANYDTIMEMSAAAQGLMHHTKDHEEGVAAILEKREPVFKGESGETEKLFAFSIAAFTSSGRSASITACLRASNSSPISFAIAAGTTFFAAGKKSRSSSFMWCSTSSQSALNFMPHSSESTGKVSSSSNTPLAMWCSL